MSSKSAKKNGERVCLLVLGMHRSGTSALTRVLSLMGADLPKQLIEPDSSNETGYWESIVLQRYHDHVLNELDSSWSDWRSVQMDQLSPARVAEIRSHIEQIVLEEYGTSQLIVIKEPRICRFSGFFSDILENLGIEVRVVLPFRNPLEVCDSLERRNDFLRSDTVLLWLRHVLEAERASRGQKRHILTYENLLSDPAKEIKAISKSLSLGWSLKDRQVKGSQIRDYLSDELRHHVRHSGDLQIDPILGSWLSDTYQSMLVLTRDPDSQAAKDQLDKIYEAFEVAAPILHRIQIDARAKWETQTADLKLKLTEQNLVKARIERELATASDEGKRLNQELLNAQVHLESLSKILRSEKGKSSAQKATISKQRTAATKLRTSLKEARSTISSLRQSQEENQKELERLAAEVAGRQAEIEASEAERQKLAGSNLALQRQADDVQEGYEALQAELSLLEQMNNKHQAELSVTRTNLATLESAVLSRLSRPMRHLLDRSMKTGVHGRSRMQHDRLRTLVAKSGLFDQEYYLQTNPDVRQAGSDPLDHYIDFGGTEARNPSRLFDSNWYLSKYHDVAQSKVNPLVHYIEHGAREGRSAMSVTTESEAARQIVSLPPEKARFDADGGMRAPLNGRAVISTRQSLETGLFDEADRKQSSQTPRQDLKHGGADLVIDVIVPVYEGLEAVKKCLNSLVRSPNLINTRVLIINDCTPNRLIDEFLDSFIKKFSDITYLKNEENLGFVKTVNRGFALSDNDKIILNADTEVSSFWVDRIVSHALQNDKVGTVTPFSNNGTICSFPSFGSHAEIFGKLTTEELSNILHAANFGKSSSLPTGVGFCMYVSNALLEEVGPFNEDAFGLGYGEENDLCRRAAKAGYANLHAHDVFVFHEGEVSFKTVEHDLPDASQALLDLHPEYDEVVAKAFSENASLSAKASGIREALRHTKIAKNVYVYHNLGGGTERVVRQHIAGSGEAFSIVVQPVDGDFQTVNLKIDLDGSTLISDVAGVKEAIGFIEHIVPNKINIHHSLNVSWALIEGLSNVGAPLCVYVHDFFSICGRIYGLRPGRGFCGFPTDTQTCTRCLLEADFETGRASDMLVWRALNEKLYRNASEVVAPSVFVARQVQRLFPHTNVVVDTTIWTQGNRVVRGAPVAANEPKAAYTIALLGVLVEHKGLSLVNAVTKELQARGIKLVLVGHAAGGPDGFSGTSTGPYTADEMPDLVAKYAPDAIWITSIVPETYSFTLSEALQLHYPIIVNDVGALPERAREYDGTFIIDHTQNPKGVVDQLENILRGESISAKDQAHSVLESEALAAAADAPCVLRQSNRKVLLCPTAHQSETLVGYRQPDACGYVRLLGPASYLNEAYDFELRTNAAALTSSELKQFDLIFANRTSLISQDGTIADALLNVNTPLVLDIDDQLFDIPETHIEREAYSKLKSELSRMVERASLVTCSTRNIADYLEANFGKACAVIQNGIEPKWFTRDAPSNGRTGQREYTTICYYGTDTHQHDWDMIEPDLMKLCKVHGGKVSVDVVGVFPVRRDVWPSEIKVREVPLQGKLAYPAFCSYMANSLPFDIGLAPLVDNEFNKAKSELKILEISCMGGVPLYSGGFAYDSVELDQIASFVRVGGNQSWFEALNHCVSNIQAVRASQAKFRDMVIETRSVERNAKALSDVLAKL